MDKASAPELTSDEATLLSYLQGIWREMYTLGVNADRVWTAQRMGAAEVVTAGDVYELRDLVKQDAIAWKREQYGHQS
jgi:hypothetical protein